MNPSKRLFDLFWTAPGLVMLSPLWLFIAACIKLDDGGPVFFRQERIGRRGKPFRMWKFRTMVVDAERTGGQLTVGADSRITRVGRWLRANKLDELPQLLNVLSGEMSLVGPRPEVPRYVALYNEKQRQVLELIPGITDLASIQYRSESQLLAKAEDPEVLYITKIMPDKLRINLNYAEKANLFSDFVVILSTLAVALRKSSRVG